MSTPVHEGRCLCGAVRLTIAGRPKWAAYCHCTSCRKQTGAPVSAYVGFEREQVVFAGEPPARFASSPGVTRSFCARCGSTLTFEGERWPGDIDVHVGALDHPETFAPTVHAFAEERIPWLHLAEPPLSS